MSDNRGNFGSFATGLLIGGIVGTAVTLLNVPQSGEETREQIKAKSIELRNRADEEIERIRAQAEEMLTEIRTKADETQTLIAEQMEDMQARVAGAIKEGKEGVRAVQEELVGNSSEPSA
jgi:gas vesicle protein